MEKKLYKIGFEAKMTAEDLGAMHSSFCDMMNHSMLVDDIGGLRISPATAISETPQWCKIRFTAWLDDEDVDALKSSFYDAMNRDMLIGECAGLEIKAA